MAATQAVGVLSQAFPSGRIPCVCAGCGNEFEDSAYFIMGLVNAEGRFLDWCGSCAKLRDESAARVDHSPSQGN